MKEDVRDGLTEQHRIIRETAPSLEPIVRWGLPFYVKGGKDVSWR